MRPSLTRMAFCRSRYLSLSVRTAMLCAVLISVAACSPFRSADAKANAQQQADASARLLSLPLQSEEYPAPATQAAPRPSYPVQVPTSEPGYPAPTAARPDVTPTAYPVSSPTSVPPRPTNTVVVPATDVPDTVIPGVMPTEAYPVPTPFPTDEGQKPGYPAVPTSVPMTETPYPVATLTEFPTKTPTSAPATATQVAPTATQPAPIVAPTATSDGGYPIVVQTAVPIGDGSYPAASPTADLATVAPTATTIPSATPEPSATPSPAPTATAVGPTSTPAPLATSTSQPRPTNTPTPTATPLPATATPMPTATALPPTAVPTATPIALPTSGAPTLVPTATLAPDDGDRVLVRHRVLPGENLFSISRFYAVSVAELVRLNGISNSDLIYTNSTLIVPLRPGIQLPTNATATSTLEHTIAAGETLGFLSVKYDVPVSRLVALNNISNPDLILVNTKLLVPIADGTESVGSSAEAATIDHTIRPGETLSGISAFYNVSQSDLIRLNNLADPDLIFIGLKLQVPAPVSSSERAGLAVADAASNSAESQSTYGVKSGDTLIGIAVRYNVSVLDLARLNGIAPDAIVFTGQSLALPANASVAKSASGDAAAAETASSAMVSTASDDDETAKAESTTKVQSEVVETAESEGIEPARLEMANASGNIYMIVEGSLMQLSADNGVLDVLVKVEPIVEAQGALPFDIYAGTGPTILGSRAVIDFRVSEDQETILVLRAYESAKTIAYDILLVDSATGVQTALVTNLPTVLDIEWSLDEEWVSFVRVDDENEASVFAMPVNPPDTPVYIGSCQLSSGGTFSVGCQGLAQDTEMDSVIYVDGRGMWRGTFDGFAPTLLSGYASSGALVYDPIAWSPDGRYLLMWGGYIEGGQRFVYDSVTERVAPVPFSSSYIYISAVSWVADDQLLVLSPSEPSTGQRPVASLFELDGSAETMLTMLRDITIPTVGTYTPRQNGNPGVQIWSPASFDASTGPFAIISTDDRESGVYLINLDDSTVTRLNGLPEVAADQYLREVVWAPDGQSAIMVYSLGELTNRVYWISANASTPTALPLSEAICCVQWK